MVLSEPRRDPENAEHRFLERYIPQSEGRLLDIGCGDGRLTWSLAGNARHIVGTDLDMQDLRIAQKALIESDSKKICFTAAQGESLPFAKETFNQAIFSWSF
jgi:ubiquinone/menaquinone biosynthesis C-methylase UbiE